MDKQTGTRPGTGCGGRCGRHVRCGGSQGRRVGTRMVVRTVYRACKEPRVRSRREATAHARVLAGVRWGGRKPTATDGEGKGSEK